MYTYLIGDDLPQSVIIPVTFCGTRCGVIPTEGREKGLCGEDTCSGYHFTPFHCVVPDDIVCCMTHSGVVLRDGALSDIISVCHHTISLSDYHQRRNWAGSRSIVNIPSTTCVEYRRFWSRSVVLEVSVADMAAGLLVEKLAFLASCVDVIAICTVWVISHGDCQTITVVLRCKHNFSPPSNLEREKMRMLMGISCLIAATTNSCSGIYKSARD